MLDDLLVELQLARVEGRVDQLAQPALHVLLLQYGARAVAGHVKDERHAQPKAGATRCCRAPSAEVAGLTGLAVAHVPHSLCDKA